MRTAATIEGWGKALLIAAICASSVAVAPGCSEDKCKTPKITEWQDRRGNWQEGPAIQCNIVVVCKRNGGRPDSRERVKSLVDPVIVDRGSRSGNESACIDSAKFHELIGFECNAETSPEPICLDVGGPAGGPGPVAPPGTTIVTVGAGSGDYRLSPKGAGGAGGFSAEPGDEDQGGGRTPGG
jgi:hypothetical protein